MVTLRPYRPEDAPALLSLFRDTIRRVNSRDYSAEQIAAWASDDIDPARWACRFTGRFVPVAEEAGCPVGFAELEPNGHIDRCVRLGRPSGTRDRTKVAECCAGRGAACRAWPAVYRGEHHRSAILRGPGICSAGPAGGDVPRG